MLTFGPSRPGGCRPSGPAGGGIHAGPSARVPQWLHPVPAEGRGGVPSGVEIPECPDMACHRFGFLQSPEVTNEYRDGICHPCCRREVTCGSLLPVEGGIIRVLRLFCQAFGQVAESFPPAAAPSRMPAWQAQRFMSLPDTLSSFASLNWKNGWEKSATIVRRS